MRPMGQETGKQARSTRPSIVELWGRLGRCELDWV
jgi:hypothetical protein